MASRSRLTVEVVTTAVGVALVATAFAANQSWLDRHFLPSFFLPRGWYVRLETAARVVIGAAGVFVASVARPRLARFVDRAPARTMHIVLAVALALGASEVVLRRVHLRPTEWLMAEEEPRRVADARLGWVLAPARIGHRVVGGRDVEYAIDRAGYRVRRVDEPVDPAQPSIVFSGESVMFGEGLASDETVPAQVGAMLGVQSANLAVHGYSNDQAFLRLEAELPRFRQPLAVVTLFMTALFGRNLDDDRPHLGPGLVWLPAQPASRLQSLAALLVPYRTDATVERGVAMTRTVLQATVQLARARGAAPIILVPQFGSEDEAERRLRERIVDDTLPSLLVTVEADWRLPWDRHPNPRAAHAIAEAIARELSSIVSGRNLAVIQ
jgi:hypothetical protein